MGDKNGIELYFYKLINVWLDIRKFNSVGRSLPDSSVHRILQARILDWVAISFSRGSSLSRGWTQVSCIAGRLFYWMNHQRRPLLLLLLSRFSCVQLCATPEMAAHQAPPSLGFSRQEHWSGLPFPSPMHEVKSESEVTQSCPTLCDPMDCSLPGSSVHGIFQAWVLEWGAITFSEGRPLVLFNVLQFIVLL